MEESIKRLRSFDFFMGLGFLAVGLFVMYDGYVAWTAPALSVVPKPSNPGVTTLFVGGSLVFLGLVIAVIGLRGSGNPLRIGKQAVSETIHSKSFWRGCVVLAGIAIYFFGFWGRIPYVISTFIFLAGMMFIFKAGAWWKILIISGVTVAIVWYIFGELAMIPLP